MRARLTLLFPVGLLVACGAGNLAERVAQPKTMSASEAMNESSSDGVSCLKVGARDTPLIVDMKGMDRADLEEAMHQGVSVVSYDCHKIKLLEDCKLPGDYGFVPVSPKHESVQLESADDVTANLPFSGALLVKAGYGRASSIDLATVMIGKWTTCVRQAAIRDAVGQCDGATHFVRGAYVGAFAMKAGAMGKVETAASIFGASASGKSDSSKQVDDRDGDPGKCDGVAPDAKSPPADCGAILRLELVALSAEKAAPPADTTAPPPEEASTCPAGTVSAGGACTNDVAKAHACLPDDSSDCAAQCKKGDEESCASLAVLHLKSGEDAPGATKLLEAACTAGIGKACNGLGVVAAKGIARPVDFAAALTNYLRACDLGYMNACYNVAFSYAQGQGVTKDPDRARSIYERACAGGVGLACMNVGVMIAQSSGPDRDMARAVKLFERACYGGVGNACANLAVAYVKGDGVTADASKAKELVKRACSQGYAPSCAGH